MKMKPLAMALGFVLGIGVAGCASQEQSTAQNDYDNQYPAVTGSYIPQNVQKNGPVTNGKDNMRIIGQSELQRSGGADLNQALRQLGANQ